MMTVDDHQPGTKPLLGPFQTEAEVRATHAVRAVYAAFDADPGMGKMAPHSLAMLLQACETAGVELGAYDDRIAAWLATWEPQTVAVIAGWVSRSRASEPGAVTLTAAEASAVRQALADAAAWRMRRPGVDRGADIEQAAVYEALLRRLVTRGAR